MDKAPAVTDLKSGSGTLYTLTTRFEDASIPRANIYGTIPFKNAALRLMTSLQNKDHEFDDAVKKRNQALKMFKVCKYAGYATIVLGRKGRQCSYAAKVLQRVDERWVRYVNGTDNGRPRYIPFDGIVPNERSVYPSPNALEYNAPVSGVNHQNIYKTQKGLDQVAEGMRRIGMEPIGPPPPPSGVGPVAIYGPSQVEVGCGTSWSAAPSGGVAPHTHVWTVGGTSYDTGSNNQLSYTPTSTGTLWVEVRVTDAQGSTGSGALSVTVTSGNCT